MKFVCLICDSQMKVVDNERQRAESTMSIVLECPDCFGRIGMLTNPMETRLLDSLDVSVCPVGGKGRAEQAAAGAAGASGVTAAASSVAAATPSAGKCPVPHGARSPATEATVTAAHAEGAKCPVPHGQTKPAAEATVTAAHPEGAKCPVPHLHDKVAELIATAGTTPAIPWSNDAERRLENVPSFAREMARLAIEGFAREAGASQITPDLMNEARVHLGF